MVQHINGRIAQPRTETESSQYMLIYTCNILIYVDDCLLCTPSDQVLDMIIEHLRQKFNITTENYLETYLGIKVQQ